MKFVKSNGYAGAFVWTLDLDDFTGACDVKYPLLNGIQEELAISNPVIQVQREYELLRL